MQTIEIKTLIDITNTKVIRPNQGTQQALDQQRNFITLNQCVELRSIISYEQAPIAESVDIKSLGFGTNYKGKQKVWTFKFSPDRDNAYFDGHSNTVGTLIEDLHEVPVIKNLTETVNIDKAIFDLKDPLLKNTIITATPGTA
jgi:hypothetical protein